MRASTNLALRPFRNERTPWLMATLVFAAALILTVSHARFIAHLLSGDEAKTVRVVREDEARIGELEDALGREPPLKVETAEVTRLRAIKDLVDRRVFPWRRLLAELEATLSPDVRLNTITPAPNRSGRGMLVALSGHARTKDAAFSFAEGLDRSAAFSGAVLKSLLEEKDETRFDLEVAFDPGPAARRGAAGGAPLAEKKP